MRARHAKVDLEYGYRGQHTLDERGPQGAPLSGIGTMYSVEQLARAHDGEKYRVVTTGRVHGQIDSTTLGCDNHRRIKQERHGDRYSAGDDAGVNQALRPRVTRRRSDVAVTSARPVPGLQRTQLPRSLRDAAMRRKS